MKKPNVLKQPVMLRILYAMVPVLLASIYYFGWRVFMLVFISCIFSFLTEWIMSSKSDRKVTTACFVTAGLYSLSLPPTVPFWIAAVGAIVAILFGKEAFGGFGRNIFNPAIVGRAFVYICFPVELTSKFVPTFNSFPGGFTKWSFISSYASTSLPVYISNKDLNFLDTISSATPLLALKQFGFLTEVLPLMIGNIGEVFSDLGNQYVISAGSCGEVSFIVIFISLFYLLYTKTIQYRLFLGTIIGALLSTLIIKITAIDGIGVPTFSFTLLSGGLMFSAVFMVTEPITAPRNKISQWIYSIFIGMMIVLFRFKAVFAGGVAFSILLGNMLAPSLDFWYNKRKQTRE